MSIETLVEFSNRYGKNAAFVLAGGGNTSYKNEDYLYIKGSGTSLAAITEEGFVKMDRAKLAAIWKNMMRFSFPVMKSKRQLKRLKKEINKNAFNIKKNR